MYLLMLKFHIHMYMNS